MAATKFLLLCLALLLIALSFIPNFTSASLEEANALQKWKASLKIPNNSQILSSWTPLPTNTTAPASCPSWFGIACNADGNINRLNFSMSELKAQGKCQGNWNAGYNFIHRDLQLEDLVEVGDPKNARVLLSLTIHRISS
ncbi:leucine-rich repeat receptor-like protein kinase family protein [Artemisia annua]|uniref:Leucine-rich repeat receptor-like protein kinase family protein n=1 Tax=Artemisia annua TaxID=35608 RepID=A0A2U1QC40_ARTAN|nr:leucine-rich repeat receptor-like protein kinase family protein [Artemisia annua]